MFVQNRLREIATHSDVGFGYVPTTENPADLPTRGINCSELRASRLWWHGPEWLVMHQDCWPKQTVLPASRNEEEDDSLAPAVTPTLQLAEIDTTKWLLDIRRYSSLHKMLRVTAYCLRFVSSCRLKLQLRNTMITAQEISSAQRYWELQIQKQCFPDLIDARNRKKSNWLRQSEILIGSDGIVRFRGRYLGSTAKVENEVPTLLPKNHPFTDLVIMNCHHKVLHSGVKHTLAEFRKRYWVAHGRNQVKRVLKNCNICRYYGGQPYRIPPPAKLPDFRVQRSNPFEVVGIDYLGPLLIRTRQTGETCKVWICLFTCASIRAIHLEVVADLSTEQFLLCFRRFVAAYGHPKLIISDNAKHFRTADQTINKLWKEVLNSTDVQSFATKNHISWKFITELAPWMGGFYERMVGLVKSSLKKTIHNRCLSLIELQTVTCEVMSVINSRPLLYSEESVEQDYLSPSHFLMKSTDTFPSITSDEEYSRKPVLADDLIIKWKRIQARLDEFWKSWSTCFLQSLREYVWKPNDRNTTDKSPAIGTMVIIKDSAHRSSWKIGVITELTESHDGLVRSVVVRTSSGNLTRRPIKLLTPLESSKEPVGVSVVHGKASVLYRTALTRQSAATGRRGMNK